MSLLEDVFLQDEANEAQELERIIEGDEFEGRPRSDSDENSEKEDEAEEDKRRVDPNTTKTRRVIKNPRFILNPARLTGPRGIQVIPDHFKDFKFKGKGHEREDLDLVLKKLEHWAYRLYPKFQFEDCLKKIETLGKKRPVMVHLHKIRSDQFLTEETVVQKDSSDEETPPQDEFDKLLQQQIELARSTPAPGSVKKILNSPVKEIRPLLMPKATSSPSISEEQRERMLRNRKMAEERRLARLKNQTNSIINNSQNQQEIPTVNDTANKDIFENGVSSNTNKDDINEENMETEYIESNTEVVKRNRSNVIDSSDSEEEITAVNESIRVDVHDATGYGKNISNEIEVGKNGNNEIENGKDVFNAIGDGIYVNNETENDKNDNDVLQDGINVDTTKADDKNVINAIESGKDVHNATVDGKNLDKSNDNINLISNSCNNVDDKAKESNEEIVINLDNAKDDNNLEIDNETESNTQETHSDDKMTTENDNELESKVNSNNQEIVSNPVYVEDLMDVDFSEEF